MSEKNKKIRMTTVCEGLAFDVQKRKGDPSFVLFFRFFNTCLVDILFTHISYIYKYSKWLIKIKSNILYADT